MEIEQKRRQDEYNASVQNLYTRAEDWANENGFELMLSKIL